MSQDQDTKSENYRIAISASFTAEPLQGPLQFWGRRLGRQFDVRFAPYNQLWQTLHNPGSEFGRNQRGLNVMLVRMEDLGQFSTLDEATFAQIGDNWNKLVAELASLDGHLPAPLLIVSCPPSPPFRDLPGSEEFRESARARLEQALAGKRGMSVLDWQTIAARYPVDEWHNAEGEKLGRIPFTDLWFASLATAIWRHADALSRTPYKVIAVDCDNTLWDGICGEDGPEGVTLDPARQRLHHFLLAQREAGMVLCMASKNNEQDVLDTFAAHPEFPLRPEHFTASRINWDPKPLNLASLSEELSLGLDSFIFIDDNPKECAEMEEAAPDVLSLTLPARIEDTPQWLEHVWAFDHPVITDEDRKRSASYEQVRAFRSASRGASSMADFMESLGLTLHVSEMTEAQLPRVSQLTQRTNQFNTTTIRRSEADVAALAANGRQVFTATVADRFGDYGLTGLLILEPRADALWVDSFLLSCRVLGRGVEHRMLAFAGQTAFDQGLEQIAVPITPTRRNQPVRQFIELLPGATAEQKGETTIYRFSAVELGQLKWTPAAQIDEVPRTEASAQPAGRTFNGYANIARALARPAQVLEAIRQESLAQYRDDADRPGAPSTETEHRLARIWAELLRRRSVLVTDNFFDLGGHSLLAVLLLMRIKEEFGIELSVDDVYSGTLTLGELARTVDAKQLGDISAEEYDALLREIEGLSDDEVRALLAAQETEGGKV